MENYIMILSNVSVRVMKFNKLKIRFLICLYSCRKPSTLNTVRANPNVVCDLSKLSENSLTYQTLFENWLFSSHWLEILLLASHWLEIFLLSSHWMETLLLASYWLNKTAVQTERRYFLKFGDGDGPNLCRVKK